MGRGTRWFRVGFIGAIALVISLLMAQALPPLGNSFSQAQAQQGNPPPPRLAPALPMVSGSFEDPQQRFQIGILEGFNVSSAGGSPLFQAADGSLAYTVVVTPLTAAESPDAALVDAAQRTFGNGEGRLSQGAAPPQPITGKIFARQRGQDVFLLLVAATDGASAQLSDAITALGGTLIVP
jgi:hypothetical protein